MSAATTSGPGKWRLRAVSFRKRAFGTPVATVLSIVIFGILAYWAWLAVDWAIFRAVWRADNVGDCTKEAGACWSVIDARHRLILFGLYPYEEHWRSTLACLSIILTVILSCFPVAWTAKRLISLWVVGFAIYYLLMEGSLLGLTQVTTDGWGGLSLTLFLFASVVLLGMPMGLEIGRASCRERV